MGEFGPDECAQIYALFAVPVVVMVAGVAVLAHGAKTRA